MRRRDYWKRNQDNAYWGSIVETTARAFAEYVKGQNSAMGNINDFLAHTIRSEEAYQERMYELMRMLNHKF